MFPTFLITFREVIEASIIISLVVGVLTRLDQLKSLRTVWLAAFSAFLTSLLLVGIGSLLGLKVHTLYENNEAYIEGSLMFISAAFITWAVFFLHRFTSLSQRKLTKKIVSSISSVEKKGLFVLIYSSVLREGIEIALFILTLYFTTSPQEIMRGFLLGTLVGIMFSYLIFRLTQKTDLSRAIKIANLSLILFSAGLVIRGIHKFSEVGLIPEIGTIALKFIPPSTTIIGGILKSLLGLTAEINVIQILVYLSYVFLVSRATLFTTRSKTTQKTPSL